MYIGLLFSRLYLIYLSVSVSGDVNCTGKLGSKLVAISLTYGSDDRSTMFSIMHPRLFSMQIAPIESHLSVHHYLNSCRISHRRKSSLPPIQPSITANLCTEIDRHRFFFAF